MKRNNWLLISVFPIILIGIAGFYAYTTLLKPADQEKIVYYYKPGEETADNVTNGNITFTDGPTDFRAIRQKDSIDIYWNKPPDAYNVILVAKIGSYPTNQFDGFLVYSGDKNHINFVDMRFLFEDTYFKIWALYWDGVNYIMSDNSEIARPK